MRKGILVGAAALASLIALGVHFANSPHPRSGLVSNDQQARGSVAEGSTNRPRSGPVAATLQSPEVDLLREVLGLMARSESGDAAASARIAAIYDFCWQYARSPQAFHSDIEAKKGLRKDLSSNFDRLESQVSSKCSGFVGRGIGLRDVALFSTRAATQGSLAARVNKLAGPILTGQTPDSDVAALASQALRSRDVEAIAALAPLMGVASAGRADALGGLPAGSALAEAAWNTAACRMGRDCGPQSQAVAQMCLSGGINCELRGIEDFYRRDVLPPGDSARLGQIVEQLTKGTGP